jgi:hypothetical protein
MMAKQDSYNVSDGTPHLLASGRRKLTKPQDQVRVRYQCRRAGPPDYPNDSAYLAQMISQMAF